MTTCTVCHETSNTPRCDACEKVAEGRWALASIPVGSTSKGVHRVSEGLYRDAGMAPAVRYHFVDVHNPTESDRAYFAEQNANWSDDAETRASIPEGCLVFAMYL